MRDVGCLARLNATVVRSKTGAYRIHVNATGAHNHARNEILYQHYAESRRVVDPELLQEAENMIMAGAKARGI